MSNYKISKTSLIALGIYLLLNFFFFSKTYRLSSSSQVIAFSPNSKMIAVASGKPKTYFKTPKSSINKASSTVEIRKVFNGKVIQTLNFPAATSLAFSPDNKLLATGNYGKDIQIWRISDGQLVHTVEKANPYIGRTRLLAFTPDGNTLIAFARQSSDLSRNNEITVWDLNSNSRRLTISKPFTCAAISTDGQLLAFGGQKAPLTIYQVNDGTSLRAIYDKPRYCSDLNFSADGKMMTFSLLNNEQYIYIYSLEENKILRKFVIEHRNDRHYSSDTAMSSNSKYLAVSYIIGFYGDGFLIPSYPKAFFSRIRIWNVENGRLIKTIAAHKKGINAIAFSPNGKWLASAGRDSTIKLWRMPPINYRIGLLAALGLAAFIHWRKNQSRG